MYTQLSEAIRDINGVNVSNEVDSLRTQTAKVPKGIRINKAGLWRFLLTMNEFREFHGISDGEDRHWHGCQVIVTIFGVELNTKAIVVSYCVRRALFTCSCGYTHTYRGCLIHCLEKIGFCILRNIRIRDLEVTMCKTPFSMDNSLRNPFIPYLGQLFKQHWVLHHDRTSWASCQREMVAIYLTTKARCNVRAFLDFREQEGVEVSLVRVSGVRSIKESCHIHVELIFRCLQCSWNA